MTSAVVDFLRADENISLIGLWERSMGAVSCLMYGAKDPPIVGMVLDSPFSKLVDLMMELVDSNKFRLVKLTVKLAIHYLQRAVLKRANFDIKNLNTIKGGKNIIKFEGDHNSPRRQFYFDSMCIFFNNVLQTPEDELRSTLFDLSPKFFGEVKLSTACDVEHADDLLVLPAGRAADSTEDAIECLGSSIVVLADLFPKMKN